MITSHIRQILTIIIIQLLHKNYALFKWNPVPWVPGVTGTFLFVGLGVDDYFALSGQGMCVLGLACSVHINQVKLPLKFVPACHRFGFDCNLLEHNRIKVQLPGTQG